MKYLVCGYVAIDITPKFRESDGGKALHQLFQPGKMISVDSIQFSIGGNVPNTGIALRRFGAETTLMGMIGDDDLGMIVRQKAADLGETMDLIVSNASSTSYTIVLAPPECDRIFLSDPGANDLFDSSCVPEKSLSEADLFHFGYPTLMRRFYENDGEELQKLYSKAKTCDVITSLDLAMFDPDSAAGQADWKRILARTLPYVDFFVPSFEELCLMLRPEHYQELLEESKGGDPCMELSLARDIVPLAEEALELGAKAILLKCGAAGLYLQTSPKEVMDAVSTKFDAEGWNDLRLFEKSFVPDRIASGTGAGDTAIAAFLYGIGSGRSARSCLAIAAGTGASNITEYDSLSGLLPIEELESKIEMGWEKQSFIRE